MFIDRGLNYDINEIIIKNIIILGKLITRSISLGNLAQDNIIHLLR